MWNIDILGSRVRWNCFSCPQTTNVLHVVMKLVHCVTCQGLCSVLEKKKGSACWENIEITCWTSPQVYFKLLSFLDISDGQKRWERESVGMLFSFPFETSCSLSWLLKKKWIPKNPTKSTVCLILASRTVWIVWKRKGKQHSHSAMR